MPLSAQRVTGTVRDSVSGLAIPGAVISAFDSAGHPGLRTISDEAGRFSLEVASGPARLRIIRIGFEPRTIALPAGARDRGARLQIRMLALPALLTRVRVSDKAICPGNEDRSGALALWDQARAGLLAAVVARQSKPGDMTVLSFVTDEDPDSRLVLSQTTRTTNGTTGRPFVAVREAGEFARQGYMARDGSTLTFFAPDADVLLDQQFAATHCFSIVRDDAGHRNELGLAFEPSPGGRPDGFVDVDGTLWIASDHPALRTLDFAYTGLDPAYRDAGTGGELLFRNMANGLVYIESWSMHLPAMAASSAPGGRIRGVHVVRWRELGGEVLSARWPDGSHTENALGVVTGTVRDDAGQPIAEVQVRLDGTPSAAETDSTGRFLLSPVLSGRYGLDVADSAYAPFVDPRHAEQTITVGRDTVDMGAIVMTGRTRAVRRLCEDDAYADSLSTVVLGTVAGASGPLASGTNVAVSWTYRAPDDPTPRNSGTIELKPGHDGRFVVCEVPFEATLHLRLVRGDSTLASTTVTVGRRPVQTVEWRVRQ